MESFFDVLEKLKHLTGKVIFVMEPTVATGSLLRQYVLVYPII